jgi:hypothetical protein
MTLTVTGIVQQDPEVVGGLLALGPRLIMNIDDVPATNLLQPGNRASYRLLVAGRAIDAYRDWALARLERGQRLESIRDLRPEIRLTLERADKFLGLAALVAVILAAVAVALAASRYLRRHLDAAAMMRCFGAPQGQTLLLFVVQFLVLGIGASVVGTLVALGGQQLLVALLGAMIHVDLPPVAAPAPPRDRDGLRCCSGLRCRRSLHCRACLLTRASPRSARRGRHGRFLARCRCGYRPPRCSSGRRRIQDRRDHDRRYTAAGRRRLQRGC